jgi:hypothetical protein
MGRPALRRKVTGAAGILVAICLLASDLIRPVEGKVILILGSGLVGSLLMAISGAKSGRGGPVADGLAFSAAAAAGSFFSARGRPGFDLALGEAWLAATVLLRPGSILPGAGWVAAVWMRDAKAVGLSLAANAALLVLLSLAIGAGGLVAWMASFPPMLAVCVAVLRRKARAEEREAAPRLLEAPGGALVLRWGGRSLEGLELSEEGSVAVLSAESLLSPQGGPGALGALGEALYASGYRALLLTGADPAQAAALEMEGFARRERGWHRILTATRT